MVFEYKVTYHSLELGCSFVRVADDAILFTNTEERCIAFAMGFCQALGKKFYVE